MYVYSVGLILGGVAAVLVGPDVGGEKEDGGPGPGPPRQRFRVRAFGVACVAGGAFLLVVTLLGVRWQGAEGPPSP
jgi:hypothetical protein